MKPLGGAYVVVAIVWLCFIARALFYCSVLPIWEGYDEYSHFAYVSHFLTSPGQLPTHTTRVSAEIEASMRLAPLPWLLRDLPDHYFTHDEYWQQNAAERSARQRQFNALAPALSAHPAEDPLFLYEAQQPPLYYWLMSWPAGLLKNTHIATRVYVLRGLSAVVASLVIPLVFVTARTGFGNAALAAGCAVLTAALPEFVMELSRVSNESLAVPLFSALIYGTARVLKGDAALVRALPLGLALGLGLLTKAYFLTAMPALALAFAWKAVKEPRRILQCGVVFAGAVGIAGWWYWRNYLLTGAWSGQLEAVSVAHISLPGLLRSVPQVRWWSAIDFIFVTHIWFGNWSFLQVRSWMYQFFQILALMAAIGLVAFAVMKAKARHSARSQWADGEAIFILTGFFAFFCAGLAYHVLANFVARGVSASLGWYLYAVVAAEVVLLVVGLSVLLPARARGWVPACVASVLVLLEVYATHFVLMPYYAGLIRHRPDGSLAVFYVSQLGDIGLNEVWARLAVHKPAFFNTSLLIILWGAYMAATLALPLIAARPLATLAANLHKRARLYVFQRVKDVGRQRPQ